LLLLLLLLLLRQWFAHVTNVIDVELLPGWGNHVVDVRTLLKGPVLRHLAQTEAIDDLVRVHECVHIGVETVGRV